MKRFPQLDLRQYSWDHDVEDDPDLKKIYETIESDMAFVTDVPSEEDRSYGYISAEEYRAQVKSYIKNSDFISIHVDNSIDQ